MKFVFVSFASEDASLAETIVDRLKTALEPSGVRIRYDEDKTSARLFPEWVDENIVAADRVLVLWSAHAAQSYFVRAEAEKARSLGKYVACLIDPEFNPESDLAPPFNVYLTPLVVMPDLAAQASTLSLDDDEFSKLAEELGKPPTVPSPEAVNIGASASPQEALERETKVATVDPWALPGSVEPDVAEDRLRTLYVGGLARLLAHEDGEVREAAAKYLEAEISAQDTALSALVSAATRLNSQALWNDVGALHLPRRPSDAVVAWRRASFTDAEICRRLGLPIATLGAAAVGAQAARIIAQEAAEAEAEVDAEIEEEVEAEEADTAEAGEADTVEADAGEEPADADEAAEESPEEEAADEVEEELVEAQAKAEPKAEPVKETPPERPAAAPLFPRTEPVPAAAAKDDDDSDDDEESDDDDDDDDDKQKREDDHYRVPRRRGGGAGAFFTGAFVVLLLLAGGGAAALYFLKVGEEPLYQRLQAALLPSDGTAEGEAAAPTAATPSPETAPEPAEPVQTVQACVDSARFNTQTLDAQRQALSACGLTLAAAPPPPAPVEPEVVAPAWCRNADVFSALTDATGDITDELVACGVTLPAAAPAPEPERVVETVVETVVEPCPKPEAFNGLDFDDQRPLLAACGLTLAEPPAPVVAVAAAAETTTAAAVADAVPPPGDGTQACSPTVGPPCRVTLDRPTALSRIAETFYGRPVAWCWIYESNREVFQSESRPALVRDDPNCVYSGDSYMLEALPDGWSYAASCEHKEMLSDMCPRSLAQ